MPPAEFCFRKLKRSRLVSMHGWEISFMNTEAKLWYVGAKDLEEGIWSKALAEAQWATHTPDPVANIKSRGLK
jgi:hypothetical protein